MSNAQIGIMFEIVGLVLLSSGLFGENRLRRWENALHELWYGHNKVLLAIINWLLPIRTKTFTLFVLPCTILTGFVVWPVLSAIAGVIFASILPMHPDWRLSAMGLTTWGSLEATVSESGDPWARFLYDLNSCSRNVDCLLAFIFFPMSLMFFLYFLAEIISFGVKLVVSVGSTLARAMSYVSYFAMMTCNVGAYLCILIALSPYVITEKLAIRYGARSRLGAFGTVLTFIGLIIQFQSS
ncbi:MAG: hypothetical protein M3437_07940 [Chloroflexota bacterium]|nr:hypothetical protein [Chloroflexota bacterium]